MGDTPTRRPNKQHMQQKHLGRCDLQAGRHHAAVPGRARRETRLNKQTHVRIPCSPESDGSTCRTIQISTGKYAHPRGATLQQLLPSVKTGPTIQDNKHMQMSQHFLNIVCQMLSTPDTFANVQTSHSQIISLPEAPDNFPSTKPAPSAS